MASDRNDRSPWDRLAPLQLRLALLELEAHPEAIDEGRLAGFLGVSREELRVTRGEVWEALGTQRDALARRARDDGLLMPRNAEEAGRLQPFPSPSEEEIRATISRIVGARALPRSPSPGPLPLSATRRTTRRSRRSFSRWGYGT